MRVSAVLIVGVASAIAGPAAGAKAPPASPTSTELSLSAAALAYGSEQAEVFTATVSASQATPTGTVTIKAGPKKLCSAVLSGGVGRCSPSKGTLLKAGSYSITASYKGPKSFKASVSGSVRLTVSTPPVTRITQAPSGDVPSGAVEVSFTSNEPGSTFECSLDGAPYSPCSSPARLSVGPGPHTFYVRAVNSSGLADPDPQHATWTSVGQAASLELCGTISASETLSPADAATYVITCSVTVAPGVTLTLAPGTIVKAEDFDALDVSGTLVADGTASEPVVLTSIDDDSIGGATGDGTPVAGAWEGIASQQPEPGNPAPSIQLEHTEVDYAATGVATDAAAVSVTDSAMAHLTGPGIAVDSPTTIPTLEDNTVTNAAGEAIRVEGASIDLASLNGNSGSDDGLDGVALGEDTLAVSSSLPWSGNLLPVLVSGCSSLRVPAKVTLTLEAGTIVKGEPCTSLEVEGSLVGDGTTSRPVTFTSWRDDSVGGDTNDDGEATLPAAGDWGGIDTEPAGSGNANPSIDLEHVQVEYSSEGVDASQATTTITDSAVSHSSGSGILVNTPVGIPTVEGNTVTDVASEAIQVQDASLDMGRLTGNSGSNDGLDGVALGGDTVAISSSLPWSGTLLPVLVAGCDSLRIPAKVTLTLEAGAIVKGERCTSIEVQGSLVANGTANAPVIFTSWRDDSAGGDTNDDGNATLPAAGDWSGITTATPGGGNANPTLNLQHAEIDYSSEGIQADEATTSIVDSSVARTEGEGITVDDPEGVPVVQNNTVTDAAGPAIGIYDAALNLATLNGNSGSGDQLNGVALGDDDRVTVSSSLPWSGTLVPVLVSGCSSLLVPAKVTLTLGPGTVLKGENCTYLQVQGTLLGKGTASDPVTLTSWRDDSVGGDTNDDGDATLPAAGDWAGIQTDSPGGGNANPTITLEHVNVDYATQAIAADEATTSITDSSVSHASATGIYVGSPEGVPTVSDNTVTDAAGEAIEVAGAQVDMDALNGNSGSGDGLDGVALRGDELSVSSSLPWSGTFVPVLAEGCQALTILPKVTLTMNAGAVVKGEKCAYIDIEGALVGRGTASDPVTLTSWRDDSVGGDTDDDGGSISPSPGDWEGVESTPAGDGEPAPTIELEHTNILYATEGLNAAGGSATVSASEITRASQAGIALQGVSQARFEGDTVSDAPVGVSLNDSSASYRGTLADDTIGARSEGSSTLDARETNWGSPSGPPPYGEGAAVEGSGVEYVPWVGYTPPAHDAPPSGGWQAPETTCAPVLFLGVRGSGESPSASNSFDPAAYASDPLDGLGKEVQMMLDGEVLDNGKLGPLPAPAQAFIQGLEAAGVSSKEVAVEPLFYEAASVDDLTDVIKAHDVLGVEIPTISIEGWFEYYESVEGGIEELEETLEADERNCPSQKIVLAGYSQGALVIHIALDNLETRDPGVIGTSHIGAVILLADPERVADAEGSTFGTAEDAAEGIYTFLPGIAHPDVPESLDAVTASMCDRHDFVCDFSFPSSVENLATIKADIAIHTGYIPPATQEDEAEYTIAEMGQWAAQTLLSGGLPHS